MIQWLRRLGACLVLVGGGMVWGAEFTVPKLDKAPVIDGRIEDGEWAGALSLGGAGTPLDARRSQAFMAWDEDHLYLAVRSATAPRGKLVNNEPIARQVIADDSIELWFDPPRGQRQIEQYKFGEFQMIASFTGKMFLAHRNPGYGLPTRKWKPEGLRHANGIHQDLWDFELAIPATALGFKKLSDMDWKMLLVRNYRMNPGGQKPFVPISGGFMDSSSYPTYRLRRQAPAVQQGYADDRAMLPLRFSGRTDLTYEATVNGQVQKGRLPVTLAVPNLPAQVSMKVFNAAGTLVFDRPFKLENPPSRLWTTPESYLIQDQDFEGGKDVFLSGGKDAKPRLTGTQTLVEGRVKGSKALHFSQEDPGSWAFLGRRLPVPGNLSLWVKTDFRAKKWYRRFFSTDYRSTGYLGLQEQATGQLMFLHKFKPAHRQVLLSQIPVPGEWCHISVNIEPQHVTCYVNGVKSGEVECPFVLDSKKLGHFILGYGAGGWAVDEYALYGRCLTEDEIKGLAQGERTLTGKLQWYPFLNSIVMNLTANVASLKTDCLELKVTDGQGQVALTRQISLKDGYARTMGDKQMVIIHQQLKLEKPLTDGDYVMTLNKPGKDDVLLTQPFKVKAYPWLHTQLGMRDCLLPGFTPVTVKGQTLSCVLRDYELNDNGLPQQITSKQQPLLAAPVTVRTVKSGKESILSAGRNPVSIQRVSDTTITYEAGSQQADLRIRGRFEQDGLLRLDIIFPETPDCDRLYVDIPVRKEIATLYHAVGEHIRSNPAGFLPQGKGVIFKSRSIPQLSISNFIPYVWVGGDELGVAYAADWDRGWIHTDKRDAVELFRHDDGTVSIRLNILNAPIKRQKNHLVTIALQASPVKPMPKGWRGWSDGFGYKGNKTSHCLMSPPYWGSFSGWCSRYPAFQDFNYVRKLRKTITTGKIDQEYKKAWLDRLMKADKKDVPWLWSYVPRKEAASYALRHTNHAFAVAKGLHGKKNMVFYNYTCDSSGVKELLEYPVMCGEWGNDYAITVGGSYQNYALYYLDKMLEAGMDGVYDDNTFFRVSHEWVTGNGWIDEEGTVHPSLGLWRNREYRRRQNVVMMDRGKEPWITVHHTNGNILPTIGFATNSMGMEWKYGCQDFQERFSPDYIRTVCQGRQAGLFPTVLDGILGAKTPAQRTWATRTMLASLLPHEVRPTAPRQSDAYLVINTYNRLYDFGIWQDDCVYTAYWNPANPVRSVTDDKLLVSTYRRGRKLLVVCGSYTGDLEARLAVKGQVASARNLETGAALTVKENTICFPMKKHDFAMVEVELKK